MGGGRSPLLNIPNEDGKYLVATSSREKHLKWLIRELKEETGLDGTIMSWNTDYYPGWVAHVVVPRSSGQWSVGDESVETVRWWGDVPPFGPDG